MLPEWHNAEVFQRHFTTMNELQPARRNDQINLFTGIDNVPQWCNARKHSDNERDFSILDARGKSVIVPIWNIEIEKGSQN